MEESEEKPLVFKPESYPFFKFTPAVYSNGEITLVDPFTQGVFINICCLYWPRAGKLTIDYCKRQLPFIRDIDIQSLEEMKIIKIKKGFISISFLNEQMIECAKYSIKQSGNGSKGGKPPKTQNIPTANPPLTQDIPKPNPKESNKNENEIRQDKSKTTEGSSFTTSESSNGLPKADGVRALWAHLAAKGNLDVENKAFLKQITPLLEKIVTHPAKRKIWEGLKAALPEYFIEAKLKNTLECQIDWTETEEDERIQNEPEELP